MTHPPPPPHPHRVYSLSRYFGRKVQLGPANRRQKLGLVWRNRKKISQIFNDYLCLPFFLLINLWPKRSILTVFASPGITEAKLDRERHGSIVSSVYTASLEVIYCMPMVLCENRVPPDTHSTFWYDHRQNIKRPAFLCDHRPYLCCI
jgi:hypothetical protein